MTRERQDDQSRWTESRARRELEAWRRSGDSMAEYARKRGYPAHKLQWWKGRLAAAEQPVESTALALAPAVITGAQQPAVVVSIATDEVRLEIDDPEAVHPAWLAELAAMLHRGVSA